MALAFKPGDQVVQKVKPIEGVVKGPEIVDGDVKFAVEYTGEDGEVHTRVFGEDEIAKKE